MAELEPRRTLAGDIKDALNAISTGNVPGGEYLGIGMANQNLLNRTSAQGAANYLTPPSATPVDYVQGDKFAGGITPAIPPKQSPSTTYTAGDVTAELKNSKKAGPPIKYNPPYNQLTPQTPVEEPTQSNTVPDVVVPQPAPVARDRVFVNKNEIDTTQKGWGIDKKYLNPRTYEEARVGNDRVMKETTAPDVLRIEGTPDKRTQAEKDAEKLADSRRWGMTPLQREASINEELKAKAAMVAAEASAVSPEKALHRENLRSIMEDKDAAGYLTRNEQTVYDETTGKNEPDVEKSLFYAPRPEKNKLPAKLEDHYIKMESNWKDWFDNYFQGEKGADKINLYNEMEKKKAGSGAAALREKYKLARGWEKNKEK
jgi:hypothetical protein